MVFLINKILVSNHIFLKNSSKNHGYEDNLIKNNFNEKLSRKNNNHKNKIRKLRFYMKLHNKNQENNKNQILPKKYSKICNTINCNFPFGICIGDNNFIKPYANMEKIGTKTNALNYDFFYCRYKMKSQLITYLLEFIF